MVVPLGWGPFSMCTFIGEENLDQNALWANIWENWTGPWRKTPLSGCVPAEIT